MKKDASTPGSVRCPDCHSELRFLELSAHASIRCCICNSVFGTASNGRIHSVVNRFAIWSFVLGLSSLFCMIFTGIPAIIFGTKSLKQIRQSKNRQHGKVYSYLGIGSGILFGVGISALLFFIVTAAAITYFTFENLIDKNLVEQKFSEVAVAKFPDDLELKNANQIFGVYVFSGNVSHPDDTFPATSFRMVSFPKWIPVLKAQLEYQQRQAVQWENSRKEPREHSCMMFDQETTVEQINVYEGASEFPILTKYFTVVSTDLGIYMISIVVQRNRDDLKTDDRVSISDPNDHEDEVVSGKPQSQFAAQSVPLGKGTKITTGFSNEINGGQSSTFAGRALGHQEIIEIFQSFQFPAIYRD